MRRHSDDDLYQYPVHLRLVGLGEYALPVSLPLKGLAVFAAVFVPAVMVLRWLGAAGPALWLLAVITSFVMGVLAVTLTSSERSIRALLAIFAAEVSAPRPGHAPAGQSAEFCLSGVRVQPGRTGRAWWWRRAR